MEEVSLKVFPKQYEVLTAKERYLFALAGNQGGKTTIGSIWAYNQIQENPKGAGLILAPVYDTLRHSTLMKFFTIFPQLQKYYVKKENIIYLPTGGKVFCRSADKPEHLEGLTLNWVWGDEADGFSYDVFLILQSRLSTTLGRALFTTSIYNRSWVSKFYNENIEDVKVISWSSIDNPYFPKKEYERLKKIVDPVLFDRMYNAKPSFLTGLVYSNFKDQDIIYDTDYQVDYYIVGIDFGIYDPTTISLIAVSKNKGYIVEKEFYKPAADISEIVRFLEPYKDKIKQVYLDPSQKTVALELKKIFPVFDLKEKNVLSSIYVVRSVIHQGLLKIKSNCYYHIKEIKSYSFKKSSLYFVEEPEDANNHCHDKETFVLTLYGWKKFSDVKKEDFLLTLNIKNQKYEWQKPLRIIKKKYEGEMYLYESKHLNFCITPDHHLLIKRQYDKKMNNDKLVKVPASLMPACAWIINSGKYDYNNNYEYITIPRQKRSRELKVSGSIGFYKIKREDFCLFLGIWLAEGSLSKNNYQVTIDQSPKSKFFNKIEKAIENIGFKFYKWETKSGVIRFSIPSKSLYSFLLPYKENGNGQKKIPSFVWKWNKNCLKKLWEGLMMGDGCYSKNGVHYDTVSEKLAYDFMKLCVLLGIPAKLSKYDEKKFGKKNRQDVYRVYMRFAEKNKKYSMIIKKNIKKVLYNDFVYCATVPNGTLVTMRNGCVLISGNCMDSFRYAISSHYLSFPNYFSIDKNINKDLQLNVSSQMFWEKRKNKFKNSEKNLWKLYL